MASEKKSSWSTLSIIFIFLIICLLISIVCKKVNPPKTNMSYFNYYNGNVSFIN